MQRHTRPHWDDCLPMYSTPPTKSSKAREVALPSGHYAAAVVLVAVFLLGLAVFRIPIHGYGARTTIRASAPGTRADIGQISAWLQSDEVLAAAIGEAGLTGAFSPGRLRQNLEIVSPNSAESQSFQIRTIAEDPTVARAITDRLAQHFVANYLPQQRQAAQAAELSRLRGRVRTLRSDEDRLRATVERFRQEQLSRVITAARIPPQDDRQLAKPAEKDPNETALLERIQALQAQRTALLAHRTIEHPQVVALDGQIERLQSERTLLATGDFTVPNLNGPAKAPPPVYDLPESTLPRAIADHAAPKDAMINLAARIEEAAHHLSQATWDRQQAEHQLESATALQSSGSLPRGWTADSATTVARIGGTTTPLQVLGAALLAVAAALTMYRASASARRLPPLATTLDVRQALELPVVAELGVSIDTSPHRSRMNLGPAVRITTHLAEAVVAAIVLFCLFSALGDRSLAGEFASDPLGAMAVVADRLGHWR